MVTSHVICARANEQRENTDVVVVVVVVMVCSGRMSCRSTALFALQLLVDWCRLARTVDFVVVVVVANFVVACAFVYRLTSNCQNCTHIVQAVHRNMYRLMLGS